MCWSTSLRTELGVSSGWCHPWWWTWMSQMTHKLNKWLQLPLTGFFFFFFFGERIEIKFVKTKEGASDRSRSREKESSWWGAKGRDNFHIRWEKVALTKPLTGASKGTQFSLEGSLYFCTPKLHKFHNVISMCYLCIDGLAPSIMANALCHNAFISKDQPTSSTPNVPNDCLFKHVPNVFHTFSVNLMFIS